MRGLTRAPSQPRHGGQYDAWRTAGAVLRRGVAAQEGGQGRGYPPCSNGQDTPCQVRPVKTRTATAVAAYRDERLLTVNRGTVIRDLALLSGVLNHARREWGFAIGNVVQAIRKPRQPTRTRAGCQRTRNGTALTLQPRSIAEALWVQPVIVLALETAMRRGELLALQWENISSWRSAPRYCQTRRTEPGDRCRSTRAVDVLLRALPRSISGSVFPISAPALHLHFTLACKRAGIEGLHFTTYAAPRQLVQRKGFSESSRVSGNGHKSLQMLKRYFSP